MFKITIVHLIISFGYATLLLKFTDSEPQTFEVCGFKFEKSMKIEACFWATLICGFAFYFLNYRENEIIENGIVLFQKENEIVNDKKNMNTAQRIETSRKAPHSDPKKRNKKAYLTLLSDGRIRAEVRSCGAIHGDTPDIIAFLINCNVSAGEVDIPAWPEQEVPPLDSQRALITSQLPRKIAGQDE